MVHPTLYVRDLAASIEFYTGKLAFTLGFTWGEPPAMAGVNLDRVSMFLELGRGSVAAGSVYFVVDDVDGLYELHRRNGVEADPPGDREYGMRDYPVRDPDGHTIVFGEHALRWAHRWKSSAWTCRCAWRSGWRPCWRSWRATSA
jgi:catechol 2,3-dioxygenase-like lactoylglutathione lyase family enzyme